MNEETEVRKCCGSCEDCPYCYFDSTESYEFICGLDGMEM